MKDRARWEIFKGTDELWYFRLQANNNQIILQSEGYANSKDALSTIYAVEQIVLARNAEIVTLSE